MALFPAPRGIIPACDMANLEGLEAVVRATAHLPFIQGYKIGAILGLGYGLSAVAATIRRHTELPIVYDHQKFGTDVPDLCSGEIIQVFVNAGVNAVIIFPHAGPETLAAAVQALKQAAIVPFVGGEMTHPRYLKGEGGYIDDEAPDRILRDAVAAHVEYFVVPGTRPQRITYYAQLLGGLSSEPKFLFPGVGRGQGGDIVEAFRQSAPYPSYAIVGRGIYADPNPAEAARRMWASVEQSLT